MAKSDAPPSGVTGHLARICLYEVTQRFGRRIDLRVKTGAAEAIRALATQLPAFSSETERRLNHQVRIAGAWSGRLSARLNEPLANGAVIHIVPRLAGAKSGGVFQVVLGAALIAVAWWNPVGWLGAAAVSGMYAARGQYDHRRCGSDAAPKARTPTAAKYRITANRTPISPHWITWLPRGNVLPVLYGENARGVSRVVSQGDQRGEPEGDGGRVVVIGR